MKKKQNTKDKLRVWGVGIIALLVVSTAGLLSATMIKNGQTISGIITIVIALLILVFATVLWKQQYSAVKKGFPYEDERSKKILNLAFAKAYLFSIYLLLAIGWASSDGWIKFRDVSQATGAGILGMAIIFGLCWVYYNNKSNIK